MISITQEDEDEINNEDMPQRDINECHTDIEDVDGPDNERRVTIKTASLKIVLREDDGGTDVEDCVDSGEEEEVPIKETDISLNEFLDQGCVDESNNLDTEKKNEKLLRTLSANKSPSPTAFGLGVPQVVDGLTDCEEMCTSGDEIEEKHYSEDDKPIVLEDSQGIAISDSISSHRKLIASNRMNRHPSNSDTESENDSRTKQRPPCARPKKLSVKTSRKTANIEDAKSDVENMFFDDDMSCMRGKKKSLPVLETPDIEIMAFDGGSDLDDNKEAKNPEINILFHSHNKKTVKKSRKSAVKSSTLLNLPKNSEEALTDLENLDSSDDDENFKVETKNLIPIALVKSDALTDVSDFEDASEEEIEEEDDDEKPEIVLPSPLREMTIFCEDEHGEPKQETVPLPASYLLSVNNLDFEKGLTDVEDFSEDDDEEDENNDSPDDYEMKNYIDCDSGIVQSSDHTTDLTESTSSSNLAQVSKIKENRERKTSELRRRRKPKPPTSNAKSNFLDTKFYVDLNATDGHTDVEDLNMDNNEA